MSGPYFFGVGNGKVSDTRAKALDRIAKRHDPHGFFTAANMPEGPRYWFPIPNCGAPFDRQTSAAILDDAKAAGLWPINGEGRS